MTENWKTGLGLAVLAASIEAEILQIVAGRDFSRRIPAPEGEAPRGIVQAINSLLDEMERSERALKEKLAELADARDDAQTTNLLLKKVKGELRRRSDELDGALVKATSASSAKSQFLANMSHEIRTPMNGILGMAELLSRAELPDKQRQQVRTIVHSGRALLTIINDILDFSKIESGKFELDPKPFDLSLCIGDIVELLIPAARHKGLALKFDMDASLPRTYVGDAGRIRQIVTNLTGNAVKFTDKGGVTLTLTGVPRGGSVALQLAIQDTGIGIPPEKVGEVFETFSQVDQTCTRRHEGTGLGLSICKSLAGRMGGDITVTSTTGVGSTFTFLVELPVSAPAKKPVQKPSARTLQRIAIAGPGDETGPVAAVFKDQRYAVATAAAASDFTTGTLADWMPDVMILAASAVSETMLRDLIALRTHDKGAVAPIMVVVTIGNKGDARLLEEAGARAYFSDTVEPGVLIEAVAMLSGSDQPAFLTRHAVAEASVRAGAAKAGPDLAAGRSRILIVDDSLVNQEVAREFLDGIACDVEIAGNGQEAVAITSETAFDLILMDCQMPVMDGYAATAAIRSRADGATRGTVPIIALTANAFASDREKCLQSGMSDFLSKPFRPDEFDSIVRKWLQEPRSRRSSIPATPARNIAAMSDSP